MRLAFAQVLLAACVCSGVGLGAPRSGPNSGSHGHSSTPARAGHAFCGAENPDVLYEGATDTQLVEVVCRAAVQVASVCAEGTRAIKGIAVVRSLGMLPVIGKSAEIRSIEFSRYSASFTDVAVRTQSSMTSAEKRRRR